MGNDNETVGNIFQTISGMSVEDMKKAVKFLEKAVKARAEKEGLDSLLLSKSKLSENK